MMKRRAFIASLTGGLLATPLAAKAQPAGKGARPPRVGVLMLPSEVVARTRVEAFRQGLRDVGYVEGDTIVIDIRYIDGHYERFPALLADLLRLDVSVMVAHGTPPSLAAKRATDSIPIVAFEISDPVGIGLFPSLAKPGGDLTGVAQLVATEIYQKQLQLLQEVVPKLSHVAILWNPANPPQAPVVQQTEIGAKALGISLRPGAGSTPADS